jgi:hypothetical protein
LSHHALPQKVLAILRPSNRTGDDVWPFFLASFAISRAARARRFATGT